MKNAGDDKRAIVATLIAVCYSLVVYSECYYHMSSVCYLTRFQIAFSCVSAFYTLHSIACYSYYYEPIDRSCVDSSDWYGTDDYDPDGDGGVAPFSIECNGDYLVFSRVNQGRTRVDGYAPNVSAQPLFLRYFNQWDLLMSGIDYHKI